MIVNFEDRDWEFDLDEITLAEARTIKRQTGLSLMKLQEALSEADVDALAALYWLMKHQNGVTVDVTKVEFKLVKFAGALADAAEREREAAEEAGTENPTEALADEPATT